MKRQPPRPCAGCGETTSKPTTIRVHMEGSGGPGGATYGCPDCLAAGRVKVAAELLDLGDAERMETR